MKAAYHSRIQPILQTTSSILEAGYRNLGGTPTCRRNTVWLASVMPKDVALGFPNIMKKEMRENEGKNVNRFGNYLSIN